jgi:carboxypeptidase C (cathepsin A)
MGALALTLAVVEAAVEADKFTQLPGFSQPMRTNSYSGYLTVSETKQLHYVFLESKSDPSKDPVVIWFNGGPGCSSLLGLFQENGPFVVDDQLDPIYQENMYAWYNNANMLYLESPAGVGYSINKETNLTTNDTIQSADAMTALLDFYSKYPERKGNQLFISGESYAGIYVPYLAWEVNEYNKKQTAEADKIKLTGFLVGNGATNWDFDSTPSYPQTVYNFNMIPTHLLDFMEQNDCVFYLNDFRPHKGPKEC